MRRWNNGSDEDGRREGEDRLVRQQGSWFVKDAVRPSIVSQKPASAFVGRETKYVQERRLGIVRSAISRRDLSHVGHNIANENITADLIMALSNMYKKPSPLNKEYLMCRLSIRRWIKVLR